MSVSSPLWRISGMEGGSDKRGTQRWCNRGVNGNQAQQTDSRQQTYHK